MKTCTNLFTHFLKWRPPVYLNSNNFPQTNTNMGIPQGSNSIFWPKQLTVLSSLPLFLSSSGLDVALAHEKNVLYPSTRSVHKFSVPINVLTWYVSNPGYVVYDESLYKVYIVLLWYMHTCTPHTGSIWQHASGVSPCASRAYHAGPLRDGNSSDPPGYVKSIVCWWASWLHSLWHAALLCTPRITSTGLLPGWSKVLSHCSSLHQSQPRYITGLYLYVVTCMGRSTVPPIPEIMYVL